MCNPKHKIKFCTCSNKQGEKEQIKRPERKIYSNDEMFLKKKEELEIAMGIRKPSYIIESEKAIEQGLYFKFNIEWHLQRYCEDSYGTIGIVQVPGEKLNETITSDYVLGLLNSNENLFDFEYLPKEKDVLRISQYYEYGYVKGYERPVIDGLISFIYTNNKWTKEKYLIRANFSEIASGQIKQNDSN